MTDYELTLTTDLGHDWTIVGYVDESDRALARADVEARVTAALEGAELFTGIDPNGDSVIVRASSVVGARIELLAVGAEQLVVDVPPTPAGVVLDEFFTRIGEGLRRVAEQRAAERSHGGAIDPNAPVDDLFDTEIS